MNNPLTNEALARVAYEGFDGYWTEDGPGKESEAWAASARAVIAHYESARGIAADAAAGGWSAEPGAEGTRPEPVGHVAAQPLSEVDELAQEAIDLIGQALMPGSYSEGRRTADKAVDAVRRLATLSASQPAQAAGEKELGERLYRAEGRVNTLTQELASARGCISEWVKYGSDVTEALGLKVMSPKDSLKAIARLTAQAAVAVPAQAGDVLTDAELETAAFAVLRRFDNDQLWKCLTNNAGPYEVTRSSRALIALMRAAEQAVREALTQEGSTKA